jgi:hypothetical protein
MFHIQTILHIEQLFEKISRIIMCRISYISLIISGDVYRQKNCIAIYHDIFSQYRDNIMIF